MIQVSFTARARTWHSLVITILVKEPGIRVVPVACVFTHYACYFDIANSK